MKLDFLDLLPEGAAAESAGQGANNIIDSYVKRQMDLEQLNQTLVKNDMDRKIQVLTLPTKIMTDNLQNVQKLNLLDPEPTEEHVDTVMSKLFPGQDINKLNDAQLATLDAQAKELAKAEAPKPDPFDPTEWMKSRGAEVMSDQQRELGLEREKIRAMIEREELKVFAAALQKKLDREHKTEENEKAEKGRNSRNAVTNATSRRNKDVGEAGQYGRQSLKEAQDLLQSVQTKYLGKRFRSSKDRKDILQNVDSILVPEVKARAEKMFQKDLEKEGYFNPKTITPPTSIGAPKKVIGGHTYEKRADGQWHKVK